MIEKSVVPREVSLLIKNTTTKPEYCSERKGCGLRCTQKTTFLQTTVGLSNGAEAQCAEVTCHSSLCLHSGQ